MRGYLGVGNRVSLKEGENNLEDVLWWVESHVHFVILFEQHHMNKVKNIFTFSTKKFNSEIPLYI